MQQNNENQENCLTSKLVPEQFTSFIQYLEQKQTFIQKQLIPFLTNKQAGLGHSTYFIKSLKNTKGRPPKQTYHGSWYDIRNKLQKRVENYSKAVTKNQQGHNLSLILSSDLLIWSIPNLCSSYIGMMNYIRKYKAQQLPKHSNLIEAQRQQLCKKHVSQYQEKFPNNSNNSTQNLYKLFLPNKDQLTELNLLKMPLMIISDYFQKWQAVVGYYEHKIKEFKDVLGRLVNGDGEGDEDKESQEIKRVKVLMSRATLEKVEIQNRVKQAQKYIQDIQTVQVLDPQVYKNRLILNQYQPALNPKNKYLFRFGKRLQFLKILKHRTQKAQKHLKQRKDAIYQLVDKQKFYIEILTQYIDWIKKPIQALNVLSQQQKRQLFCNIQQIRGLHIQLYQLLNKRYQQDHKYQTYGDIMKSITPFFKLYIDYIYIAQSAQNFLKRLISQNQQIRQICDKYFIQKHKTAPNELIQPTFKIARYEMMYDQILKKTNQSTKDFKLFTQAKQIFKQNLTQVNDTVDKIVRRNKLNQLQQQFGTPQQPIFTKQNCEYLNEFQVFLVLQQKRIPVIVFAFTDVILIVEKNSRKKIKYILVDKKYYAKRQEDSKIYRNIIKIHSEEGFLTFTTGNQEKNLNKAVELYDTLKKIEKESSDKEMVYIQVLGTEEIGSTSFAKYTEYIIQVKYLTLKKLLHLRFSQISSVVKAMQNFYKNNLGISQEQALKKTWLNNHKSKTIQDRKRVIQQILQKLFNNQQVKKDPKYLLNYLSLPQNFFQTAKKLYNQKNSQTMKQTMTTLISKMSKYGEMSKISRQIINNNQLSGNIFIMQENDSPNSKIKRQVSKLSKTQLKQAVTLLCATEIKLGRDIYHDMDAVLQQKKEKAEKIQIQIHTMKDDEVITVRVTEFDTVEDVCNKVSKLIGLRSNRDFRLFHQIGKKQLRVLQHQQLILKIFKFPNSKRQTFVQITSFFQSMTSSIKKIISPQTHPTLIFKKYYYLPYEIQQRQTKKDLTRLRLLTYQIFAEIKDMKYQLNIKELCFFTALLIYIELQGDFENKKIDQNLIYKVIPETIMKLKNYTEQEWLKKIQPELEEIQKQIKSAIEYNKEQIKYNKIKADTMSKTALYFGHRHMASKIVLNKIKSNPVYGSNLFYIQPYKKTYQQLKNQNLKMSYNMWLAVKVNQLSLLTPSSKQFQFKLQYKDIDKIDVYSQAIVFKTDDYLNKVYRLNTYQSFEISQLVKYYKTLNEVMKQLSEDQKLAKQVKKYRHQIEQYRSTYEVFHEQSFHAN